MDLRNHGSHLHYIHVIKKGTVVELLNQSPSGVPAQKFRDINDIYDDEDSLRDISLTGFNLRNASVAACSNEGMKILICSASRSLWDDPFSDEEASVGDTTPDNNFSDELTLEEIAKKFKKKGKKRKTPESGFENEAPTTGKEHSVSQPNDDLSDLLQPLSCIMSDIRNKRRVNVVESRDLLSQSQNAVLDFDNGGDASLDKNQEQQIESTTENSDLTSTIQQPSCPNIEDDNNDCTFSSLNLLNVVPTIGDISGEAANSSQGSKMMYEEEAAYIIQNQESLGGHSSESATCIPDVVTMHKETENQEHPEGAHQCLQQGCVNYLHAAKLSSQEDKSATPFSDISTNALSPSSDLGSQEHDRFEPQRITSELISQAGSDPMNFPCIINASEEAEIMATPEMVCVSVQQLSQTSLILSNKDVQECIQVTPLPDKCLHALSSSVDYISDKHGNSEPCCTENEMDFVGADNLVKSVIDVDRFTINENENLPDTGKNSQSSQTGLSPLPVSDVTVHADTSTTLLLDVPSDASTSAVNLTPDISAPTDMYNNYQISNVNQQTDDRLEAITVEQKVEVAKTSNPSDNLTTKLADDSGNQRTQSPDDELPSVTSCSIVEASTSTLTGSCCSMDKPFTPESFSSERKDSSPTPQNKLWTALENIDTIDSREKLRSLGKLVADDQIKQRKRSTVKGNEIRGSEPNISKKSESKDRAHERKHAGFKAPRDRKKGQSIPSGLEGAIIFSKKQMQDFQALAKKLTSELASMKGIVEERLNHEASTPDHINDQVVTAINKASKAEETARKRLLTMNRDCVRFCTLMNLSKNDKDTANSETITPKRERKKIKFADEVAGGELCQIMLFETEEASAPATV